MLECLSAKKIAGLRRILIISKYNRNTTDGGVYFEPCNNRIDHYSCHPAGRTGSALFYRKASASPTGTKRSKVPVVKAKVGPQFINFICDEKIFDSIPVKKQIKAMVSGIYIVEVKGLRGRLQTDSTPRKKSWVEKLQEKAGAKPVK